MPGNLDNSREISCGEKKKNLGKEKEREEKERGEKEEKKKAKIIRIKRNKNSVFVFFISHLKHGTSNMDGHDTYGVYITRSHEKGRKWAYPVDPIKHLYTQTKLTLSELEPTCLGSCIQFANEDEVIYARSVLFEVLFVWIFA